jgi:AraC family transcriptional activator of mtrCDE
MDGLSTLIRVAHLDGGVDMRCLMAGQFTLERDATPPNEAPFYLVLQGRCAVTAGPSTFDLGPGDMLVLPRGEAHQVRVVSGPLHQYEETQGPTVTVHRTIGAEPELDLFCGHYLFGSSAGALLFRLLPAWVHVTLDGRALALANVLREEAQAEGPGTAAIMGSLCDALLGMALRSRPEHRLDTPALWTAMGDDVLGRVIAGIVDRPGEPWTIDRMAAVACMSRATFLRRFTARTGTTVATLLTSIRMMLAIELLLHTDHSVAHIGREVGYTSESAFVQAFRATVGEPPAQVRRNTLSQR